MASLSAMALPPLFVTGSGTYSWIPTRVPVSRFTRGTPGSKRYFIVVAKAAGDDSDSSGSIVKFVQNAWNNSEDRLALVGLGFAGIVAIWASSNLIVAIDKLPVIPSFLEFIGILFSWWFIYRYLLFKPDSHSHFEHILHSLGLAVITPQGEELVRNVKNSISNILGQ